MHNKFTSVSLESKTWCASLEEADALIHNALVNPTAPYSRTAYSSSYSKPSLVNYGGNRKNRE